MLKKKKQHQQYFPKKRINRGICITITTTTTTSTQTPTSITTTEKITESETLQQYFKVLDNQVKECYLIAEEARKKGFDPEKRVDIPLARNMAERVEGLISAVAPELVGSGMTNEILRLEKTHGAGAWEVGLLIAEQVAKEKFCKFEDKKKAMEVGIRTGMAYTTTGIVAAPLEGFIELKIKKRKDGKEYFSVCYAGPIRGAGGTAASVSVIIADYVRKKMGYAPYDPTEDEVKRYITEINDYHERVTNLQYHPSEEEIVFMIKHLPVEINGDPTEKIEVSNYQGLPRIETNRIRGGMCLVVAEGLTQKAPKLWKRLQRWGKDFDLEWDFLKSFLDMQKRIKAKTKKETKESSPTLTPNYTYIKDLVAGRPVLSSPMAVGGLRLRFGRTRTSGFSAAGLHPATQFVLDRYIATGTQLKVERPGKAASITICESIEGPTVRLKNGNVIQLKSLSEPKEQLKEIEKVLFLGDILFNYGDFSENGHMLIPPGYCEEWHIEECKQALKDKNKTKEELAAETNISLGYLSELFDKPVTHTPNIEQSILLSQTLSVPLHPHFTYYWGLLSPEQLVLLISWLRKAKIQRSTQGNVEKLIVPFVSEQDKQQKLLLEKIGMPHAVSVEHVVFNKNQAQALFSTFPFDDEPKLNALLEKLKNTDNFSNTTNTDKTDNLLDTINQFSPLPIRDKAGTFIGARMGRPEKAKMRKLTGSPQILFPVGEEGGRLRSFQAALDAGKITADFPVFKCHNCDKETIYPSCETCDQETILLYFCKVCGPRQKNTCPSHGPCVSFTNKPLAIKHYFQIALKKLGMRTYPDLIKGVRGTSNKDHFPENLVKGILRAKHNIYVNKDGTTRYDMSELPITHFKPKEIGVSVEKLKELGYEKDMHGEPLTQPDQLLEIKPQDIILPGSQDTMDEPASDVLFRVGKFIDDLMGGLYQQKPFYQFKTKAELIGQLVIGIAPHISAGVVGRIIGFSQTQGCFCHPLFHAAMRRDCDGDEACVMLLMDALLNFSRQFLPDSRGSRTMDSPLVLTAKVIPTEVDDQVHGVDVVWGYPLAFYEACLSYKKPWDISIEQIKHRLETPQQYEEMGFTHPVGNINKGIRVSSYKTLPSMQEKLMGQMDLAVKICAVSESDVARLVIEKHFLKDTKGNLRKFSKQQFRCVKCNTKYRRPPLIGRCTNCKGDIIFTISEGSVVKYLEPSISLATNYNVPVYLQQTLELLKRRVEAVFGREKEKQMGLGAWFG